MLRVTPCMHCMHAPRSQALHVLSPTNFIQQQFRKKKQIERKNNMISFCITSNFL